MTASDTLAPIESLLRQSGATAVTAAALYVACILLSLFLCRAGARETHARLFWLCAACTLAGVGSIEALGLPARVVDAVRIYSIVQGWYETRGDLQVECILALVGMYAAAAVCAPSLLSAGPGIISVACALGLLPVFIIIRATSVHDLDCFFRLRIAGMAGMGAVCEIAILCFILWQLLRAYRMGIPKR
jgi:hypothetical protein